MGKEYDRITAFHYASYRPSLHGNILKRCLGNESFDSGLDIGCGTGQSSIILSDFCNTVVGIDPSIDMISKAITHPIVHYSPFDKKYIDFEDNTFDIITLAGSLWYAKSQELLDEVVRVGSENAKVLVYDFEVLLEDILAKIGFDTKTDHSGSYNHQEDFSSLDTDKITMIEKESERISLKIALKDLGHLILSVKKQYICLGSLYGSTKLYDNIVNKLSFISDSGLFDIQADTFFTLYRIN